MYEETKVVDYFGVKKGGQCIEFKWKHTLTFNGNELNSWFTRDCFNNTELLRFQEVLGEDAPTYQGLITWV